VQNYKKKFKQKKRGGFKMLLVHAKVAKYCTQRTQRVDNQCQKLCALCVFLSVFAWLKKPRKI